jgi:Response regulator of the LytR/AlgR family
MIRVLIADDEPLARERIRTLLEGEPDIDIISECSNGLETVSAIEALKPDLVFLDVQMPEMGGFEVLETVGVTNSPVVVFVTAYDQYALKAFEVHALDYLLKPFDRERFEKALGRAKIQIEHERGGDLSQRLLALLKDIKPSQKYTERLVIKSSGRVFFLRVDEIDWIESAGELFASSRRKRRSPVARHDEQHRDET